MSKKCYIGHQAYYSEIIPADIHAELQAGMDKTTFVYGPQWVASFHNGTFEYKQKIVCDDRKFLPLGEHMRRNVTVWLFMLKINWLRKPDFVKALELYKPLPHRLEKIWTYKGITWINDSFATTASSVVACINSLGDKLETIFLWGYDNHADPSDIIEAILGSKLENIILFPTTGKKIRESLGEWRFNYLETKEIWEAVVRAYDNTSEEKYAALSCWYPSFTMRDNYTHRGENFTEVVQNLASDYE